MREILFRGKRIDGGGWANGFYISCGGSCILDDDDMFFGSDGVEGMYSVDPATVGQYTGLKDRNGVRIFEGDIISMQGCAGYVRFGTYASAYSSGDTHVGFFIEWIVDRMLRIDLAFWTNQREIEVIGNIHDNPELLEVQSD